MMAMAETAPIFRTKKIVTRVGEKEDDTSGGNSRKPLATIKPRYAPSQRRGGRGSADRNAHGGDISDHRMPALELTKPPSAIMSRNGRNRISRSWLKRKNR